MSIHDSQSTLVISDAGTLPFLPDLLTDPALTVEALDKVDIYIFNNSASPLFQRAKEISAHLRGIAREAKLPFQNWGPIRYTKDDRGRIVVQWVGRPPPDELKKKIIGWLSDFEDESRSLWTLLKEISVWQRKHPAPRTQSYFSSHLMKKKLEAVYERVQELKDRGMRQMLTGGNPLQTILPYELKPVIEEFPILENEFKRRAFYYSALARNQEYLDFIAGLHKQIKEIQSLIDPTKLPSEPRLKRPRYTPAEDKEDGKDRFWQEMKGIHTDLSDPKKWWYLGTDTFENGMPFGVGDSLFVMWKPVVEQYGTVTALMQHAFESGAMEQTEKNIAVYQTFKDDVQKLKEIFEKPLHQLHISDFEHLAHCMLQPEWMGNEERDIQRTKGYVDRVYKDLLLFLDELEEGSVMEAPPVQSAPKKKGDKGVMVNGVTINMENQKVSHPTLGSAIFKTGFTPWRILRICAQEEPDGLGKASLDTLSIADSDIYKKLGLINKHFAAPIAHFKNGMVHLDPDFKS